MRRRRALIVSDADDSRQTLRALIDSTDDMVTIGDSTCAEAVAAATSLLPDVIVLTSTDRPDERLGKAMRDGPETAHVHVLVMRSETIARHTPSTLTYRARSLLPSREDADPLLHAIRSALECRSGECPRTEGNPSARPRSDESEPRPTPRSEPLTARELSIVRCLSDGKSNGEIARALHISEATVKANLGRVMRKWDSRDRVQTLLLAIAKGVVQVDAGGSRDTGDRSQSTGTREAPPLG